MTARRPTPDSPATGGDQSPQLVLRLDVDPTPEAARDARSSLRVTLQESNLTARISNAALDVAHELVVNAVQHATPPVRLVVHIQATEVRIEVSDASPTPARVLPYRPGVSDHGLGLQLVRHLARNWGQEFGVDGKTVWAIIS